MNVRTNTERGVTLTELLVVMLIIALLSTIAVPVYLSRAEVARIRTAQADVREIAMAEDICAAIHGFYVPLQTLDDVPATAESAGNLEADAIDNYDTNMAALLVEPTLPLFPQVNNQFDLSDDLNSVVAELIQEWQGPFINYNRTYLGVYIDAVTGLRNFKTSELDVDQDEVKTDVPLDPWGQPYRIFSPIGLTGQNAGTNTALGQYPLLTNPVQTIFNDFNLELKDNLSTTVKTDDDPYDTWAIVSFGPNRVADGDGTDGNDDIYYLFGMVAPESGFTSRVF